MRDSLVLEEFSVAFGVAFPTCHYRATAEHPDAASGSNQSVRDPMKLRSISYCPGYGNSVSACEPEYQFLPGPMFPPSFLHRAIGT